MRDVLTESGKEIKKDISGRKPKDKVTDHSSLLVWDGPILELLIKTTLTLSGVLVWTINYMAALPEGRDTEL